MQRFRDAHRWDNGLAIPDRVLPPLPDRCVVRDGCLYRRGENGKERLLKDFNDLEFQPLAAPYGQVFALALAETRMRDLIRAEARAALRRWGEVLIAGVVAVWGLWLALSWFGIVQWIGVALAGLGAAWTWSATQRARFATRGEGPGVVSVVEGEIRYFGPMGGGFAPIEAIDRLALSGDGATWLITTADGSLLPIPRAAEGADALFDAFAALEGLSIEHVLRVSAQSPTGQARMIWSRRVAPLLT
ncbi:MAG: hypothetical protein Kow0013_13640 [Pararhodobacter sp.]